MFALRIAAALAVVLGGSAAVAYPPYVGAPCGYGLYGGGLYGGWWPGPFAQQCPPYFALYPPVYYSHPIARPYGFSPFAYPPGTMTPEVIRVQPLMVFNPFVAQSLTVERPAKTSGPLRIRNPYVNKPESGLAAFDGLTTLPAPRPQVIYPARLQ
jgi:hypothetical protein